METYERNNGLLASDWEFITSEGRPDKLLKQLQQNEQELLRFKDNGRFPATEVNEWLQIVPRWMKNLGTFSTQITLRSRHFELQERLSH